MKARVFTDGACLGNPGPMGLGIHLVLADGRVVDRSIPFGRGTNNVAEYSALVKALELAREEGVSELEAFLDSKLVVEQVSRNWRVKDEKLQPLVAAVWALIESFDAFSIEHVPRAQNAVADALSKRAAERVS